MLIVPVPVPVLATLREQSSSMIIVTSGQFKACLPLEKIQKPGVLGSTVNNGGINNINFNIPLNIGLEHRLKHQQA